MTFGEILILSLFLLINFIFLIIPLESGVSITHDVNNRFGWIAMANLFFVFPLACRNSILVAILGISYERAIKFHRWVGKMVFFCVIFHGFGHIQQRYREIQNIYETIFEDQVYMEGFMSFIFLTVIYLTSLSIFRRY